MCVGRTRSRFVRHAEAELCKPTDAACGHSGGGVGGDKAAVAASTCARKRNQTKGGPREARRAVLRRGTPLDLPLFYVSRFNLSHPSPSLFPPKPLYMSLSSHPHLPLHRLPLPCLVFSQWLLSIAVFSFSSSSSPASSSPPPRPTAGAWSGPGRRCRTWRPTRRCRTSASSPSTSTTAASPSAAPASSPSPAWRPRSGRWCPGSSTTYRWWPPWKVPARRDSSTEPSTPWSSSSPGSAPGRSSPSPPVALPSTAKITAATHTLMSDREPTHIKK